MTAKTLHITAKRGGLALPISYTTATAAILGKRRSGKSYKGSVLAEELLDAGQQIVVLDPTSAWYGLRSSADGKSAGYPITIIGGEHGDIALDPASGAELARAIVHERFSAILDFDGLTLGAQRRFSIDLLETLYREKRGEFRTPLHIFADEADFFAPQKPMGDESRLLGATETIVRRGGIKGIGSTLITQRPASISKGVLSQVDTLIALRLSHRADMDQIDTWVGVHGDPKVAATMMKSLPDLPVGDAWVWSPSRDLFGRVTFRDRHTYDSGRTPEVGSHLPPPKAMAKVDLEKLGEAIAKTAAEAKASDPKHLRARVAELEKQLASGPVSKATDGKELMRLRTELESVTLRAAKLEQRKPMTAKELARYERSIEQHAELIAKLDAGRDALGKLLESARAIIAPWSPPPSGQGVRALIPDAKAAPNFRANPYAHPIPKSPPVAAADREPSRRTSVPKAPLPSRSAAPATGDGSDALPPGEAKILAALIQFGDLEPENLTVIVGYKKSSRDTYVKRLITRGFVERQGGVLIATRLGIEALPGAERLPEGKALQAYWEARLPPGEWAILKIVIDGYPEHVYRDVISTATNYKKSSRDTYLKRLAARKLVYANRDGVRASAMLIDPNERQLAER